MNPSIRLRLVVILLVLMAATWIIEGLMTRAQARAELTAVFDAQLDQAARMLAITVAHESEEQDLTGLQRTLQAHRYVYPVAFQVWSGDGRLLFRSADAPAERLPHAGNDYADIRIQGVNWRVLGLELETGELVLVAHRLTEREALISQISGHVIEPLGLSLALAAVLIWFGVQGGLAPLRRLATEVAGRDEQSLAPLHTANYPPEIRGLAEELNSMFSRLEEALQRYGRFTGDAAHELRTPLAGLRIQAQAAARATDEETRQRALEQLLAGVDRMTHIIEQLLTLARIDPEREREGFTPVDLQAVIAGVVDDSLPFARERDIEITTPEQAGPVVVAGNPELLRILCRNLIDNAVRYTPPGGKVKIRLQTGRDRVELSVEDTGPGIPADLRATVLERFHRLPGAGGTGSGLGLAIVDRIAETHNASLDLAESTNESGLHVSVILPAGTKSLQG